MTTTNEIRLLNLTPHPINLVTADRTIEIPPAGPPARLVLRPDKPLGHIQVNGLPIPLVRTSTTGQTENLPPPQPNTLLIVGRALAEALPHRTDLVFPHNSIRDNNGTITGCTTLAKPAIR